MSCEERQPQERILTGKRLLQFPAGSSPDRVEELVLPLILLKGLFIHSYKKEAMNTVTRTRGALPPASWRRGVTGFIGLSEFDGLEHQAHKSARL